MTGSELWLSYKQTSRFDKPCTMQLIELEFQNHKLHDLEDVLEHVFQQGFVESKYRPVSFWERKDGVKVKGSQVVEELLKQGVGKCQETALRLVIADLPPALWFSYHYLHGNASGVNVTQRVKLDALHAHVNVNSCHSNPKLAHVTNFVFAQGYVAARLRSKVYWQGVCGRKVEEHIDVHELLISGEGVSEDKPLRLVIDDHVTHCHCL